MEGEPPDKLLFEVSISQENGAEVSRDEIAKRLLMLSRQSVDESKLDKLAQRVHSGHKVLFAVNNLINNSIEGKSPNITRSLRPLVDDPQINTKEIQRILGDY